MEVKTQPSFSFFEKKGIFLRNIIRTKEQVDVFINNIEQLSKPSFSVEVVMRSTTLTIAPVKEVG